MEDQWYLYWAFWRIFPKAGILKMGNFIFYLKQVVYLSEALNFLNLNISTVLSGSELATHKLCHSLKTREGFFFWYSMKE